MNFFFVYRCRKQNPFYVIPVSSALPNSCLLYEGNLCVSLFVWACAVGRWVYLSNSKSVLKLTNWSVPLLGNEGK